MRGLILLFLASAFAQRMVIMPQVNLPSDVMGTLMSLSTTSMSDLIISEYTQVMAAEQSFSQVVDLLNSAGIHHISEPDKRFYAHEQWNLERITQEDLPLVPHLFNPLGGSEALGVNVSIFMVDSGMNINHVEFQDPTNSLINRASNDFHATGTNFVPCSYHATGVASIAGGKTLGIARRATIHNVKVASNSGISLNPDQCIFTLFNLADGLTWVLANAPAGSIINLSLEGPASFGLDQIIKALRLAGHIVVVAAGNNGLLNGACSLSPARSTFALSVAASTITDHRANYSNYGSCVQWFAPGDAVRVAVAASNVGTAVASGTSFASPCVVGVAAVVKSDLVLTGHPATASDIVSEMQSLATSNNIIGAGPTHYSFPQIGCSSLPQLTLLLLLF